MKYLQLTSPRVGGEGGGGGGSAIHYSVEEHKTSKSNELIC